jgi:hypothetical protein
VKTAGRLARRRADLGKHRMLERPGRPPVLVYSWSKTGSTTLHHTLARAHLGRPTYHVHELDEELEARNERNLVLRANKQIPPARLMEAARLRALVHDGATPFTIVTCVRDPISRAISSFFQAYQSTGLVDGPSGPDAASTEALSARLHEQLPDLIASTDRWFDRQPLAVLGIDLLAEPFDHEAGWTRIRAPRFDIAVIRFDRLGQVGPTVLTAVTGRRIERLRAANVADSKVYAAHRRAVLDQLQLTSEEIDLARATQTMRHFFTEDEQAAFAASWSTGRVR